MRGSTLFSGGTRTSLLILPSHLLLRLGSSRMQSRSGGFLLLLKDLNKRKSQLLSTLVITFGLSGYNIVTLIPVGQYAESTGVRCSGRCCDITPGRAAKETPGSLLPSRLPSSRSRVVLGKIGPFPTT